MVYLAGAKACSNVPCMLFAFVFVAQSIAAKYSMSSPKYFNEIGWQMSSNDYNKEKVHVNLQALGQKMRQRPWD